MKLQLTALAIALSLAFTTKPKQYTLLHCYYSAGERNQKLNEALTVISSGGMGVDGFQTRESNGLYCFEITLQPF